MAEVTGCQFLAKGKGCTVCRYAFSYTVIILIFIFVGKIGMYSLAVVVYTRLYWKKQPASVCVLFCRS